MAKKRSTKEVAEQAAALAAAWLGNDCDRCEVAIDGWAYEDEERVRENIRDKIVPMLAAALRERDRLMVETPRRPHLLRPTVTPAQLVCTCPLHPCPVHGFESLRDRYSYPSKYAPVEALTMQNGKAVVSKTTANPGGTTPEKMSGQDPACGEATSNPNIVIGTRYDVGDKGGLGSQIGKPPKVCSRCNDTHLIEHEGSRGYARKIMCTSCPSPCEDCKGGPWDAFCETTPCPCRCHGIGEATA